MIGKKLYNLTVKAPWLILNKNFYNDLRTLALDFYNKCEKKSFYIVDLESVRILSHCINDNNEFVIHLQLDATVFEPKIGDILSMTVIDIDKKNNFTICKCNSYEKFIVFLKDNQISIGTILNVQLKLIKNRKTDLIAIGCIC